MMKATIKTKLCWNCEGSVPINQENCPYCSVYLNPPTSDETSEEEDDLSPPYRLVDSKNDQKVPTSPFATNINEKETAPKEATEDQVSDLAVAAETDMKSILMPLVMLLSGSVFLLFGIIMLLFSYNGTLTLQWDGNYWYVWLLSSLPLLLLGWKTLQQLRD